MNVPIYKDLYDKLNPDCYEVGRQGNQVLSLVCHNTAGPNDFNPPGQTAAQGQALSDTAANYLANNRAQASVQWLVGAESCKAPIYYIVRETDTSYNCGGLDGAPSHWTDPNTGNQYVGIANNHISIGIEVLGQPNETLGPNQLAALKILVQDIARRYPALQNPNRIIAHADIDVNRTDGRNWRDYARKWVTQVNGPNPNNYSVGIGMLTLLQQINEQAATEERYIKNSPGGVSLLRTIQGSVLMSFQDVDAKGAPLASWTTVKL